jgi:hypothetical protein
MKLADSIREYASGVGYLPTRFSTMRCDCGASEFFLFSDDTEGGAYSVCPKCGREESILDSRQYITTPEQNVCSCDYELLRIAVGVAYHKDSDDPRWVFVGGECPECGLAGVYVDWQER